MKIIQLRTPTKFGHSRSKALNATPRTWKGNHQKFRLTLANGRTQTIFTSVRTYRTLIKHFSAPVTRVSDQPATPQPKPKKFSAK